MELALILIVLVIAELILTAFMLGRYREFVSRLRVVEVAVKEVMEDAREDGAAAVAPAGPDAAAAVDAASLIAQATPEDIAKANEILAKLGIQA